VLVVLDLLTLLLILCLQLLHHWVVVVAIGVLVEVAAALRALAAALMVTILVAAATQEPVGKDAEVVPACLVVDLLLAVEAEAEAPSNRDETDTIGMLAVVEMVYRAVYRAQLLTMLVAVAVVLLQMAAAAKAAKAVAALAPLTHPIPMELQELLILEVVEAAAVVEITNM
jgi:hypothetical protein